MPALRATMSGRSSGAAHRCLRESSHDLELPEGDEDTLSTVTLVAVRRLPDWSSLVVADGYAPCRLGTAL